MAGSAEVHHGMAGLVAGREVHVSESRTEILLAQTVHGNVDHRARHARRVDRRADGRPVRRV
ncbi:MAG: hypothetical protein MZV63_06880 [Marinilabiliales bacterium]|nr:hypothetical protein [Marinilabiliales bacterium]